jgi:hypothetical protein
MEIVAGDVGGTGSIDCIFTPEEVANPIAQVVTDGPAMPNIIIALLGTLPHEPPSTCLLLSDM